MPRIVLHSSLLQAAAYQGQFAQLDVELISGSVYRYFSVPENIYQGLLQAESKGRYFNYHIRNRFAYAKIHSGEQIPKVTPMPSS